MTALIEIKYRDFPLNEDRYNRLAEELRDATHGFGKLIEPGWPGSRDFERRLISIREQLDGLWNDIKESQKQVLFPYLTDRK